MRTYEHNDSVYVCGSTDELQDISRTEEFLESQGYDISALEFIEYDKAIASHYNEENAAIFHFVD